MKKLQWNLPGEMALSRPSYLVIILKIYLQKVFTIQSMKVSPFEINPLYGTSGTILRDTLQYD